MPTSSVRVTVEDHELTLSNLDKVLFPEVGFTKGQLIDYYVQIAPVLLPHLHDRPLTLKRYPNGVDEAWFFEKHAPSHLPAWSKTVRVPSSGGGGAVDFVVVGDLPSLVWAANLATIEFHVPLWRVGRRRKLPGPPDCMVFDLDPGEGTTIAECCEVAVLLKAVLDDRGASVFAKTSGSKGLQLYSPLEGPVRWERLKTDVHAIALSMEHDHPALVVSKMAKALRPGKVLIDWSQNTPSKTTVAAYSVRGMAEPTVSTPVTWKEVRRCASSGDAAALRFTTDHVLKRVKRSGDLFKGTLGDG
jgi:bifunctional non-homologous end joining protein LigD